MKKEFFIATVVGILAGTFMVVAPALAQSYSVQSPAYLVYGTGNGFILPPNAYQSSNYTLGLRFMGYIPLDLGSSFSEGGTVSVSNQLMPQFYGDYFFTPHLSVELSLGTGPIFFRVHNTSLGSFNLGRVWAFPTTLLLQYHFKTFFSMTPYIGAGANLTWYGGVKKAHSPNIGHLSFITALGPTLELGDDYQLMQNVFLNIDLTQSFETTHFSVNYKGMTGHVSSDPTTLAVGVAYRF